MTLFDEIPKEAVKDDSIKVSSQKNSGADFNFEFGDSAPV